jgi:hypothetical protein
MRLGIVRPGMPAALLAPLIVFAAIGAAVPALAAPPRIQRTFVYHQLTEFPDAAKDANDWSVLSGNGQRVVYAAGGNVFAMKADGSGVKTVDSYTPLCACELLPDVSDNGLRIVSTDGVQIRATTAAGTGRRTLLRLTSAAIGGLRLTGDGRRVIFALRLDAEVAGRAAGAKKLERGIYAVNFGGGGPRRLAGPAGVAARLKPPGGAVIAFGAPGIAVVDASTNGSKIVFSVVTNGSVGPGSSAHHVMGMNGDGSGLHVVMKTDDEAVIRTGISGDGRKVHYELRPLPGGMRHEVVVAAFSGGGRKVLSTSAECAPSDRRQLTRDGAQLLCSGTLYDTKTGAPTPLFQSAPALAGDPPPIAYLNGPSMSMDLTGRRILYQAPSRTFGMSLDEPRELALLAIDPVTTGAAPRLSNPTIRPPFLLPDFDSQTTLTITARGAKILRVASNIFRNGRTELCSWTRSILLDDGTIVDRKAGDGVYTAGGVGTGCTAADAGPRTVRFKAESQAPNGKRHATAVDVSGLVLREQ